LSDILLFLIALKGQWVAVVTGSFGTACLSFSVPWLRRRFGRWAILLIALGGFVPASYFAWLDQHRQLLDEQALHHPKFTVIAAITEGSPDVEANQPPHSFLLFDILLTNAGAPSICQAWTAYVTNQQSKSEGSRWLIPEGTPLVPGESGTAVKFYREKDSIVVNASKVPVPSNGKADGWILFQFDIPQSQLTNFGNTVSISCLDPLGQRWWDSFPASEIKPDNEPRFTRRGMDDPNQPAPESVTPPREMLRKNSGDI